MDKYTESLTRSFYSGKSLAESQHIARKESTYKKAYEYFIALGLPQYLARSMAVHKTLTILEK